MMMMMNGEWDCEEPAGCAMKEVRAADVKGGCSLLIDA